MLNRRSFYLALSAAILSAFESHQPSLVRANAFTPLTGFAGYDSHSSVGDVSADGKVIVGSAPYFDLLTEEAARWTAGGSIETLRVNPVNDGLNRSASGVSADGKTIIGAASAGLEIDPPQKTAFRWTEIIEISPLGKLPGVTRDYGVASGISAAGDVIVGTAISANDDLIGYRWSELTGMTPLEPQSRPSFATDVSADGATIVGVVDTELGQEAFRWTTGGLVPLGDLPGGYFGSIANAISSDGTVVVGTGKSIASAGAGEAFRWTEAAGMEPLGFLSPADYGSSATLASADGAVIFGFSASISDERAFVWDELHGMRDLWQVLENQFGLAPALAGWDLGLVADISADGLSIVGNGINSVGGSQGWLITLDHPLNVPEPTAATTALLGTLLAAAACRRTAVR